MVRTSSPGKRSLKRVHHCFFVRLRRTRERARRAGFDELLIHDEDSSCDAAIRASKLKEQIPIMVDVQPIEVRSGKDERPALRS